MVLSFVLVVPAVAGAIALSPQAGRPPLQDPNHETTTLDVPGLTAATSLCAISDDATYGTTLANPIQVGGGAMYLASRETKYLSALRGPSGEGLHFKRGGSMKAPDGTIVDAYSIDYKGIDQPLKLYLDGYHWAAPPQAPKGWLCGADMNLNPPGPDPFETQDQLKALAVRLGEQPVDPISLDPDGSRAHGVVFDHVRLIALAARQAAASGKPLNPEQLPRDVAQARTVVIAVPLKCEAKEIAPESIALADSNGNSPQRVGSAKGDEIAKLAPGFEAPSGAIAVAYAAPGLIEGARVTVRYAEPCGSDARELLLPVRSERGRVTKTVPGIVPPTVTVPAGGVQVRVQVFLAFDGTPQLPAYVSGPWELRDAAIAAAMEWRVEPAKMNGAPLLQTSILAIVFRPR